MLCRANELSYTLSLLSFNAIINLRISLCGKSFVWMIREEKYVFTVQNQSF